MNALDMILATAWGLVLLVAFVPFCIRGVRDARDARDYDWRGFPKSFDHDC